MILWVLWRVVGCFWEVRRVFFGSFLGAPCELRVFFLWVFIGSFMGAPCELRFFFWRT